MAPVDKNQERREQDADLTRTLKDTFPASDPLPPPTEVGRPASHGVSRQGRNEEGAAGTTRKRAMSEHDNGISRNHDGQGGSRREARARGALAPLTDSERLLMTAGGGMLALWALRRGGLFPSIAAMAAATMLAHGTGREMPASTRGMLSRAIGGRDDRQAEREFARQRGWNDAAFALETVRIARPPIEVYRFWRDFSHLGRFMRHVDHIEVMDDRRSRWTVKAPAGQRLSWDSLVTDDRPGERIAWESANDQADIRNEGWVEFKPDGSGTEVKAFIAYEPPGGQIGRLVARIFGEEPAIQAADDLRKLKQILEVEQSQPQAAGA